MYEGSGAAALLAGVRPARERLGWHRSRRCRAEHSRSPTSSTRPWIRKVCWRPTTESIKADAEPPSGHPRPPSSVGQARIDPCHRRRGRTSSTLTRRNVSTRPLPAPCDPGAPILIEELVVGARRLSRNAAPIREETPPTVSRLPADSRPPHRGAGVVRARSTADREWVKRDDRGLRRPRPDPRSTSPTTTAYVVATSSPPLRVSAPDSKPAVKRHKAIAPGARPISTPATRRRCRGEARPRFFAALVADATITCRLSQTSGRSSNGRVDCRASSRCVSMWQTDAFPWPSAVPGEGSTPSVGAFPCYPTILHRLANRFGSGVYR